MYIVDHKATSFPENLLLMEMDDIGIDSKKEKNKIKCMQNLAQFKMKWQNVLTKADFPNKFKCIEIDAKAKQSTAHSWKMSGTFW